MKLYLFARVYGQTVVVRAANLDEAVKLVLAEYHGVKEDALRRYGEEFTQEGKPGIIFRMLG
jgi:hypothetical protein